MTPCRQCGLPCYDAKLHDGLCPNCEKQRTNPIRIPTKFQGVPLEDMKQLDEIKRFDLIHQHLKSHPGKTVAVMVDCGRGHEDKGDRYIRAVRALVPGVKVVGRRPGPIKNVETIDFKL